MSLPCPSSLPQLAWGWAAYFVEVPPTPYLLLYLFCQRPPACSLSCQAGGLLVYLLLHTPSSLLRRSNLLPYGPQGRS